MGQTTSESEIIFNLVIALFSSSQIKGKMTNLSQLKEKSGLNDEDWENVLSYSAQVSYSFLFILRGREREFNIFFRHDGYPYPLSSPILLFLGAF